MIRIGLSGWDYDGWTGDFYPGDLRRRDRLAFVGEHFDTVEANGSFYSLKSPTIYRRWADATPAGFCIALKGSRFITHNKKLSDVQVPLANFFASGVLALGDKLGPIVWQLSDRQHLDAERLRSFCALLPKDTRGAAGLAKHHDHRVRDPLVTAPDLRPIRHAIEGRHASWCTEEAWQILRRAGFAVAISHAGQWGLCDAVTAGFVYVRLHGAPETYRSGYDRRELRRWAERIERWDDEGRDVYVYFDNDAAGRAPHDALALAELLTPRLPSRRTRGTSELVP